MLAVDLPGRGTDAPLPGGTTTDRRVHRVRTVLEGPDLSGAALVGGSTGGNTIRARAARYGADRLASVVVVAGAESGSGPPPTPLCFPAR
ncbi:hypothetical protein K7G98_08150 [Saccharothrix sp. MB29]|nr:hypothetical protein [Saccharothrix sp. MB29]MDU0287962.1 hypothetical protein [Saccharothrix longispora]